MKTKHIEAMRQTRLMITEVVVPLTVAGVTLTTTLMNNQRFMSWIADKKKLRNIKKNTIMIFKKD